ncbi:hypothetical protein GCM10022225_04380 [Plantactinospora mayteni]|uniref:Lipoprotein n=1 Tax=Plantactinospora mayteni TaxID=566021 RepID=A0ABQ4EQJ6_9ACTN|nr:hypothetical protein Pma05_35000 [Plantactinospora mayteni]
MAGVGGATLWPFGGTGGGSQALAMSAAELSPSQRGAVEQCLDWSREQRAHNTVGPTPPPLEVTLENLAVAAQQGHDSVMLFLTDVGYFACTVISEPGKEVTGANSSDEWGDRRNWLPGPVQLLGRSSSEFDGGDVMVTGRASTRVQRLVLEHGDGRTTTARLKDGAFGLVSSNGAVRADARLVSYDADGNELGQLPVFDKGDQDGCYVDPAGKVLYQPQHAKDEPSSVDPASCAPAERWGH